MDISAPRNWAAGSDRKSPPKTAAADRSRGNDDFPVRERADSREIHNAPGRGLRKSARNRPRTSSPALISTPQVIPGRHVTSPSTAFFIEMTSGHSHLTDVLGQPFLSIVGVGRLPGRLVSKANLTEPPRRKEHPRYLRASGYLLDGEPDGCWAEQVLARRQRDGECERAAGVRVRLERLPGDRIRNRGHLGIL